VVDVESTFEDGAGASEFLLVEFPLGITHPVVHVNAVPADIVFEFFAFAALKFMKFLEVGEALGWGLKSGFSSFEGFAEDLFGGYLQGTMICVNYGIEAGGREKEAITYLGALFLTFGGPRVFSMMLAWYMCGVEVEGAAEPENGDDFWMRPKQSELLDTVCASENKTSYNSK
jgi:hypothetical protein